MTAPGEVVKGPEVIDTVREWLAEHGLTLDERYAATIAYHVHPWGDRHPPPPLAGHGGIGDCEACDARRILRGETEALNVNTQPNEGAQHG